MAKTKADCMALFLRLLDEATKKGVELPTTKNADYRDKFNYFLDYACKYIAGIIQIPAVYQITQNPIPNLLGLFQGFDIQRRLPEDNKVYTFQGLKSYYFEVDNVATITITINGVTTKTISNTTKRAFTAYKGNTGATSTDTVVISFIGDYPYNIRNVGLFGYAFPTDEDVPNYTPYVSYDMPEDFMEFDAVVIKTDPRVYQNYIAYKWEKNKKVVLNYYDTGSFDVHYFRYPKTIEPTAADTFEIDAEEKAIELIVMEAGIKATAADNPSLSSWLRQLYIEQMNNVANDNKPLETTVQTVYVM